MTFGRRPEVSIIVYNKDDADIETITNSLVSMDKLVKAKLEFVLVVYNKKISKSNMQKALRLKQFMPMRFIDFVEKHPEQETSYYGRAKKSIVKSANSIVTEEEVKKLFGN